MRASWVAPIGAAMALAACGQPESPSLTRTSLAEAYCHTIVTGVGTVDVETDYLPRVVQCENGSAGFEALKAQAVAARSYLYYRLDRAGEIADGQNEQVYGCGRPPSPRVHAAVRATSGQALTYRGTQVAGFYVAGAIPHTPACAIPAEPLLPLNDPFGTEHYVTYNTGLSGDAIAQTPLGLIADGHRANRGCKSQNGAACLAEQGWRYEQILRFYYGEDIEIVQTEGSCVVPPSERGVSPGSRAGAWIGVVAMLLALVMGWLLVIPALRARPSRARRSRKRS